MTFLAAVGHGFSCVEIEWENLGSLWLPKAFHHRPQAWFKVNAMDEVLLRKDGSPDGEKLWDLGWIVHKHRSRSGIFGKKRFDAHAGVALFVQELLGA